MYINTFKYTPKDVSCQLCTEYVKKLGCTSSSQSPLNLLEDPLMFQHKRQAHPAHCDDCLEALI